MNPHLVASDFGRQNALLLKALGSRAGALNVGEVACGTGLRCRMWADQGHQVYGADIDAGAIALARRKAFADGLEILLDVAAADALPWPDQSMDICTMCGVLAQAPDWRLCIAEGVRVLRPGGALYISDEPISDEGNMRDYRRELARRGAVAAPQHWWTPSTILVALKPAA